MKKFYAIQKCSKLLVIQFKCLEMLRKFCIFQFTKTFVIHYNRKNIRRDHILTYWKETWWIDKILMWIVHFVRDGLQNYNRTFKSGLKWKKISLDERFWIALQSLWSTGCLSCISISGFIWHNRISLIHVISFDCTLSSLHMHFDRLKIGI